MPKAKWVENCFEVSGGIMMLVIVILVIIMLPIILVVMHTYNAVPTIIQPGSFPSVNTHLQSSFHPSLFNQALFRQASPLSSLFSVIILSIIQAGSIPSCITVVFSHHSVRHHSTRQYSIIHHPCPLSHHCVHRYSTRQYV